MEDISMYYHCPHCNNDILFSSFYRHTLAHPVNKRVLKVLCKLCRKLISPGSLFRHYREIHKISKKKDGEKEEKDGDKKEKEENDYSVEKRMIDRKIYEHDEGEDITKLFTMSDKKYWSTNVKKEEMIKLIESQIKFYTSIKEKLLDEKIDKGKFNEPPVFVYRHIVPQGPKKRKITTKKKYSVNIENIEISNSNNVKMSNIQNVKETKIKNRKNKEKTITKEGEEKKKENIIITNKENEEEDEEDEENEEENEEEDEEDEENEEENEENEEEDEKNEEEYEKNEEEENKEEKKDKEKKRKKIKIREDKDEEMNKKYNVAKKRKRTTSKKTTQKKARKIIQNKTPMEIIQIKTTKKERKIKMPIKMPIEIETTPIETTQRKIETPIKTTPRKIETLIETPGKIETLIETTPKKAIQKEPKKKMQIIRRKIMLRKRPGVLCDKTPSKGTPTKGSPTSQTQTPILREKKRYKADDVKKNYKNLYSRRLRVHQQNTQYIQSKRQVDTAAIYENAKKDDIKKKNKPLTAKERFMDYLYG